MPPTGNIVFPLNFLTCRKYSANQNATSRSRRRWQQVVENRKTMNNFPHFVASRLREVLLNGTFIANTNFKDQITNISWEDSIKTVNGLNSVAALTFHINYYLDGLIRAFNTGKLEIRDKFSFEMQPIQSKTDWDELVNTFVANSELFASLVESISPEKFGKEFIDPKYGSISRNIEAVIEHSYYHLGQVVLIKKILSRT